MNSIEAKAFQKILTPAIKQKLLAHFNTLYACETLSAYEYKIVYSAYLKYLGKRPPQQDFFIVSDLFSFQIDSNDKEITAEETEEELPEGALLALINDSYDLDKIIAIISEGRVGDFSGILNKQ